MTILWRHIGKERRQMRYKSKAVKVQAFNTDPLNFKVVSGTKRNVTIKVKVVWEWKHIPVHEENFPNRLRRIQKAVSIELSSRRAPLFDWVYSLKMWLPFANNVEFLRHIRYRQLLSFCSLSSAYSRRLTILLIIFANI